MLLVFNMVGKKRKNKRINNIDKIASIIPKINLDTIKIPKVSLNEAKKKLNNIYDDYKK